MKAVYRIAIKEFPVTLSVMINFASEWIEFMSWVAGLIKASPVLKVIRS